MSSVSICFVMDGPYEEGRGIFILNSNLIKVLSSISDHGDHGSKLFIINADYKIKTALIPKRLYNFIKLVIIQIKNSFGLLRLHNTNSIIFFTMSPKFFLPLLISKMLRKKVIYFVSGLAGGNLNREIWGMIYKKTLGGIGAHIFPSVISLLEEFNYKLADVIILESPSLTAQISPQYLNKIIPNGSLFVNTSTFSYDVIISKRKNIISYFGALNEHKGIINLIEAIPIISEKMDNFQFFIGGSGSALPKIEKFVKDNQLTEKVIFHGKIPHNEISSYLNKTKILVLPSYGEGLPNIVLESMACGTPVLATSVGGIPDVIKDGGTGFIMENNAPESIARNVIRALDHPDLEEITRNARALVEKEYTYEKAVERYREILNYITQES